MRHDESYLRLTMVRLLVPVFMAFAACLPAMADDVVFKSDVALTRVDAQVVDQNGRALTGLQVNDFVLRVNGQTVPIRNFSSENTPLDVLLLLDVSGSMRPHVERIADASEQALRVLSPKDRIAIMIFDTSARVRLPFDSDRDRVTSELNHLLRSERFNGGTRITSALLSAASYVGRQARPEARRAIVILTDDETQDEEDETVVESALGRANAILSFLQAPYEVPTMAGGRRRHGTWGSGGGGGLPGTGWPGGGIGFPGGGPVVLGRGHGGYGGVDPSHSAGTATIAQDSGGDTIQVDEASALRDTLARLRQRYALNFYLPEGVKPGDSTSVRVDLSQEAKLRYFDAEIHYRRVFLSGGSEERAGTTVVSHVGTAVDAAPDSGTSSAQTTGTSGHRKVAVNEDSEPAVNTLDTDSGNSNSNQSSTPSPSQKPAQTAPSGGWPRATGQPSKPN
jgi:VWFA-related protein